jgi:predicted RNA-binding Zn ribbon-like protein
METPEPIKSLRIVGGNVALDLANTCLDAADAEPRYDRLLDYEHLAAWARRVKLSSDEAAEDMILRASRRPSEAAAALTQARALRADIYSVFKAVALGDDPPEESVDALRRIRAEAVSHATLTRRGDAYEWDWSQNPELVSILWPIAHAATELLTSPELSQVKQCSRCPWLFVDSSKNQSRRWCSMKECGTSQKVERYVAKRAGRRRTETGGG